MKPRLIVSRQIPPAVADRIRAEFDCPFPEGQDMDADTVIRMLTETRADALMLTSHLPFRAETIARIPDHVRIAATCSVGTDHIDIAAAKARGLPMSNTPDVLTECTADLTFMLILNACRRATEYAAIMRDGWRHGYGLGEMMGLRAWGKTLGILGLGRIGQAVAQRARGFGMTVLYSGPRRLPVDQEHGATYFADFRAMLPHCDILSLHAPGGAATAGIMNAETFALLPKGAVFVNAARGGLVDEDALIAALQSGHLFAAGLDVFRNEPEYDLRFAALPNVFLTPHMGSGTVETRNAMGFRTLDNIAAVLSGKPPLDPLWT
ncbi:2-hydroxyacid dehydrogenase [Limobrevibacterium gyesilva]|uniref:D-glycerate dehydrogenase n=1 Tax=Limobrevibacterium gyesilva TaxID=2991712 RepID=A0AA41YIS6_9PROT|nr:D-glycerate dehydrogenase [Limobrevibacterium gyesilva]MCW3474389.1 D-glycerate dehydrogenase [Limobrevibacterium gyesilva]